MTDKYARIKPAGGRCVDTCGVTVRVQDVSSRIGGRKVQGASSKAGHLAGVEVVQTICPAEFAERCGGCILNSLSNAEKHSEWFEVASGLKA
jgi:hypothetical protein